MPRGIVDEESMIFDVKKHKGLFCIIEKETKLAIPNVIWADVKLGVYQRLLPDGSMEFVDKPIEVVRIVNINTVSNDAKPSLSDIVLYDLLLALAEKKKKDKGEEE